MKDKGARPRNGPKDKSGVLSRSGRGNSFGGGKKILPREKQPDKKGATNELQHTHQVKGTASKVKGAGGKK